MDRFHLGNLRELGSGTQCAFGRDAAVVGDNDPRLAGGLLRWYPVVTGVVVIVALAVTYTLRRQTPSGRPRTVTVVRILFGTAVLLASFTFYFMLQPQPLQEAGFYASSAAPTRYGQPTMTV